MLVFKVFVYSAAALGLMFLVSVAVGLFIKYATRPAPVVSRGERVFRCLAHGYEVRAWGSTVAASQGRAPGCATCATAFRRALDAVGYTDEVSA